MQEAHACKLLLREKHAHFFRTFCGRSFTFPWEMFLKNRQTKVGQKLKIPTCSTTISLPLQVLSNLGPHCNEEGSNRQNNYRKKMWGMALMCNSERIFLGGGWVVKTGWRAIVQVWCMPNMEQRNNNSKLSFWLATTGPMYSSVVHLAPDSPESKILLSSYFVLF